MDRKSILALILIGLIIILWPYYQQMISPTPPVKPEQQMVAKKDTIKTSPQKEVPTKNISAEEKKKSEETPLVVKAAKTESSETSPSLKNIQQADSEKTYIVDTDIIHAVISNKGGGSLKEFTLKKFETYDSSYVNFINSQLHNNEYFAFIASSGQIINTKDILFYADVPSEEKILKDNQSYSIEFYFYYEGSKISRKITFYANRYHFDVQIQFKNPQKILLNNQFQIGWNNGMPLTEASLREDNSYSKAYVYMAEDLEDYKIEKEGTQKPLNLTGSASWLAIKTKYFLTSVINQDKNNIIDGVILGGKGQKIKDIIHGLYDVIYNVRYNENGANTFRYYLGPLDYFQLKKYGNDLQKLVLNNGWYERSLRFFSIPVLYILMFFNKFIPNYGIVIILFSILIKLVLYPLTKKSYESMREMQKIQPLMTELRAKYKDDPQRLNKEMMKLYKEYGVNPMGGCLPMLLQMPLLFALYVVFRSTIQLRGAVFIPGWINDLSRPEGLFHLPFSLPFYGNEFNVLPVLMAITMIFQSKMTTQDPKQKAMIYIMPLFMLLIFNQLSSGLNLYYTMFNILTIIQQLYINRGLGEANQLTPVTVSAKKKKK